MAGTLRARRFKGSTRAVEVIASPDVTVALTGVFTTLAVGTVGETHDGTVALTGVFETSAVGTVGIAHDQALTGVFETSAVGTVGIAHDQALTGVAETSAVGTLGVAHDQALTGVAKTSAVGTLTPSISGDVTVAISGVQTTPAVGTLGLSHEQVLTGAAATPAVGTVTPSIGGDVTVAISGVQATAQVGSFGVINASVSESTRGLGGDDAPRRRVIGRDRGFDEAQARRKREAEEALLEEIRAIYRKLIYGQVPALAARADEIVAPLVADVTFAQPEKIEVPNRAELQKARADLRAAAITLQAIKNNINAEIALRLAAQELEETQKFRVEYMRRITLLLQAA